MPTESDPDAVTAIMIESSDESDPDAVTAIMITATLTVTQSFHSNDQNGQNFGQNFNGTVGADHTMVYSWCRSYYGLVYSWCRPYYGLVHKYDSDGMRPVSLSRRFVVLCTEEISLKLLIPSSFLQALVK